MSSSSSNSTRQPLYGRRNSTHHAASRRRGERRAEKFNLTTLHIDRRTNDKRLRWVDRVHIQREYIVIFNNKTHFEKNTLLTSPLQCASDVMSWVDSYRWTWTWMKFIGFGFRNHHPKFQYLLDSRAVCVINPISAVKPIIIPKQTAAGLHL